MYREHVKTKVVTTKSEPIWFPSTLSATEAKKFTSSLMYTQVLMYRPTGRNNKPLRPLSLNYSITTYSVAIW